MDYIIEIENLTKDYEKGFWKKKKIRANFDDEISQNFHDVGRSG